MVLGLVCDTTVSGRQPLFGRQRSPWTGIRELSYCARRRLVRPRLHRAVRHPRLQHPDRPRLPNWVPLCERERALVFALLCFYHLARPRSGEFFLRKLTWRRVTTF